MTIDRRILVLATAVAGLSLSGCVSSPTYGTDKSAGAQLFDDVSNIIPIGSGTQKERIEYKPRPELVRPASGQAAHLPAPQDKVTNASNTSWPESPEQRRQRLRAEATENRDKPGFRPSISPAVPGASNANLYDEYKAPTAAQAREQVQQAKRDLKTATVGSADQRRYLSEPPLTYRQPATTAPIGEQGQDEAQKERARKKAAGKGKSWGDYMPWN